MFTSNQQFRTKNPKLYFIDKTSPTGVIPERGVTPVLDCWFNPTGDVAYTNIFEMNQKDDCVTQDTSVPVTPAQCALLTYLNAHDIEQIITSLENVHFLSLYYSDPDLVSLPDAREVHHFINLLKDLNNN